MKIAVTSQNRRDVTEHAGRCRNFWVFEVDGLRIVDRSLLELPRESSFHDAPTHGPHPLDDVDLLITGGMGEGLRARLARRGIEALVTIESRPEVAVQAWLAGRLPAVERRANEAGEHGRHGHGQDQNQDHGHPCTCASGGCGCH